ncbi:S1 family peptidase [Roseibium sp.]|uniref:S1 family peptidase n=1 Tax=Roseibium sp. TaxID=1936156 RepID=UPI003D12FA4D
MTVFKFLSRQLCRALFGIVILLLGITRCAAAIDSLDFRKEFDPAQLTQDERIFLKAGLALFADYDGDLDGVWGDDTQAAIKRYNSEISGPGPVLNWAAVYLAFDTDAEFRIKGWATHYLDNLDISVLLPLSNLDIEDKDAILRDRESSLYYQIVVSEKPKMLAYHSNASKGFANPETNPTKRHWITRAENEDKLTYIFSQHFKGDRWGTLAIYADTKDKRIFSLVAGSIASGNRPPIAVSKDLDNSINKLVLKMDTLMKARIKEDDKQEAHGTPVRPDKMEAGLETVASGFVVSSDGHVLTNFGLTGECKHIRVADHRASLVAGSEEFDLALLKVPGLGAKTSLDFARMPAPLNSNVTLAGFPLAGKIGGLNVTRGAVTALKGLAGTGVNIQISAPVQSGSAGGPVVNSSGQIVGVVAEKLDAKRVAEIIGDIPQNVNFAVSGEIAQLFLYQNGLQPARATENKTVPPEQIADLLAKVTVPVDCSVSME